MCIISRDKIRQWKWSPLHGWETEAPSRQEAVLKARFSDSPSSVFAQDPSGLLVFDVQTMSERTWAGTFPGSCAVLWMGMQLNVFCSCNSSVCLLWALGDPPGVLVTLGLRWVCTDPGYEPVCASSSCTCQMQGQEVCFYRAKALWKCWHSCGRMKYFLPQHCGKDGSCPAPLQAVRYVNDPTAERFSSHICRQGMLPWSAGGGSVQPHFIDVSGTAQCWPAELESPKTQPLFSGGKVVPHIPVGQIEVWRTLGEKLWFFSQVLQNRRFGLSGEVC